MEQNAVLNATEFQSFESIQTICTGFPVLSMATKRWDQPKKQRLTIGITISPSLSLIQRCQLTIGVANETFPNASYLGFGRLFVCLWTRHV